MSIPTTESRRTRRRRCRRLGSARAQRAPAPNPQHNDDAPEQNATAAPAPAPPPRQRYAVADMTRHEIMIALGTLGVEHNKRALLPELRAQLWAATMAGASDGNGGE